MSQIILNIDTALEQAIISLSDGSNILDFISNNEQKSHASILHPAIKGLLKKHNLNPNQLDAISVIVGPGSYTGLRVGMAAAKGLCYALKIPMIAISTLELMARNAVIAEDFKDIRYCPMIDARRMEVYTALYDVKLDELISPTSVILDDHVYAEELEKGKIIFFGNGSKKFEMVQKHSAAIYRSYEILPQTMGLMSLEKFNKKEFSNLWSDQPLYIKDFFTIKSPSK